jgi:coenzyme F420-reducing hydrogenase delta subunit
MLNLKKMLSHVLSTFMIEAENLNWFVLSVKELQKLVENEMDS